MGMWSMIKVVCGSSIIDAPTDSISFGIPVSSLHSHPHQLPQLTSLRKFLWTPLLMEAPFAVAPDMTVITLGTESGKVIIKVARMAHAGHAQGKHPPRGVKCSVAYFFPLSKPPRYL